MMMSEKYSTSFNQSIYMWRRAHWTSRWTENGIKTSVTRIYCSQNNSAYPLGEYSSLDWPLTKKQTLNSTL